MTTRNTSNRVNLKLSPELFDYAQVMAGIKGESVTEFINGLIAAHMEKNRAVYAKAKKLPDQIED